MNVLFLKEKKKVLLKNFQASLFFSFQTPAHNKAAADGVAAILKNGSIIYHLCQGRQMQTRVLKLCKSHNRLNSMCQDMLHPKTHLL